MSDQPTGGVPGGDATVADALGHALAALGVQRVYGLPLGGLSHVALDDWDLAVLLADADGRLGDPDGGGRMGAALLPGPILHLSSQPGGRSPMQVVGSVEDIAEALAAVDPGGPPSTTALHLDLDLTAPAPEGIPPAEGDSRVPVTTLDPSLADLRLLAVVGPGVVRSRSSDGLRSFTRSAAAPVVVSWGASGLERWDSPWLAGTCGLQQRDLELAGLPEADVVIASGLDEDELPASLLAAKPVQEVLPTQLGALCHRWGRPKGEPEGRVHSRESMLAALQPLYERPDAPLSAARAALHLSGALPDGGVAVADAGIAGFWVARAFPTGTPGSFVVPATTEPGFAAAAALVASLDGRPCVAVTDPAGASADATLAVLDSARALGSTVALQCWGDAGGRLDAAAHVELTEAQLRSTGVRVDEVAVDLRVPDELMAVAGPVVAWGGLVGGPGTGDAVP